MSHYTATAGYVPGWAAQDLQWHTLRFAAHGHSVDVAVPQLTPAQLLEVAQRVQTASRDTLKTMRVSHIIAVVDSVIARLLDANDPYRQEAQRLLPIITGFDAEMVRLGLTQYLKTFRAPQLQRFVAEDFANPKLLDEFQPRPKGGMALALGPDLLAHVWAGNVPGLPLWSLICGLLVKAGNIGKVASAEPLMASLFARLLVEVEPQLADSLAVLWWQGGDVVSEQTLFAQVDVVLAYGGNATLEQIRTRVPISTRYLPHGHKLSVGWVAASALQVRKAQAVARAAALDVVRYEQQGCYSPQVFYVARGGRVSPREFAQYLNAELAALAHKHPRRALALDEAQSVAAWRQAQELVALATPQAAGSEAGTQHGGVELLGNAAAPWCVAYCEGLSSATLPSAASPAVALPALSPSALNRTVTVVAVDDLQDTLPLLQAQRAYLQTVGVAAAPQELLALAQGLGAAGVTRICAIGNMTAPEAGWHHDGRFNLLDLVRMVELEQSAEDAAETFAPYVD